MKMHGVIAVSSARAPVVGIQKSLIRRMPGGKK